MSEKMIRRILAIYEQSVKDHAPGGKHFKYYQFIFDTADAHRRHEVAKQRLAKFKLRHNLM